MFTLWKMIDPDAILLIGPLDSALPTTEHLQAVHVPWREPLVDN